jgi:glycine/D-amino acid oxidase-like deaminating enzyme
MTVAQASMTPHEADVVVVGAGGAGLAAAVTAARHGLSVLLIEKGQRVGGTTALSVGSLMAAGSSQQKAAGISDSPQAHAADLAAEAANRKLDDDPDLRALLTHNAAGTVAFLESVGVTFLGPFPQPPHRAPRLHQVVPTSRAYIERLRIACDRIGVKTVTDIRATRLIQENGRIVGVAVRAKSGDEVDLFAKRGVILATGDLAANPELLREVISAWPDDVEPINPLATGDGHVLARAVGARIVPRKDMGPEHIVSMRFVPPARNSLMQRIPAHPAVTRLIALMTRHLPAALMRPFIMKFLTASMRPDAQVFDEGAILVNLLGHRFTDERGSPQVALAKQPNCECYLILDQRLAMKFSKWPHFISTAPGVAYAYLKDYMRSRPDLCTIANDAEELGAKLRFEADALSQAIADACRTQKPGARISDEGPLHALGPLKLWALLAPIGLAVDAKLRVLDESGTPIPGLFAAGGVGQGGFTITGHGHGLGWAFTSGRLAADSIAAQTG